MIALERKRTVSAIKAKFRGADKREKDKELMFAQRDFLNDPDKKVEFKSRFRHSRHATRPKSEKTTRAARC